MALYGIIGDVHGNREALVAALATLDVHSPNRLVCVGDIVGYNADPDECAAIFRQRGIFAVAGNHDLIATGSLGFERCSNKPMHALKRTRRLLQPGTADYLRSLPRALLIEDQVVLVHGGVRDVQQYMTETQHIRENLHYLHADFPGCRICFYGHVHEQRVFEIEQSKAIRELHSAGVVPLRADRAYFINPGSLDASRKTGQKLAQFALFDSDRMTVQFLRASYDHLLTEAKAAAAGYRIGSWLDRFYTVQRKLGLLL